VWARACPSQAQSRGNVGESHSVEIVVSLICTSPCARMKGGVGLAPEEQRPEHGAHGAVVQDARAVVRRLLDRWVQEHVMDLRHTHTHAHTQHKAENTCRRRRSVG
jgi:hypothetical protein